MSKNIVESLYRVCGVTLTESRDLSFFSEPVYIENLDVPLKYLVSYYLPRGTKYIDCSSNVAKLKVADEDISLGTDNILAENRSEDLIGYSLADMHNISQSSYEWGIASLVILDPDKWRRDKGYNNEFVCSGAMSVWNPGPTDVDWEEIVHVKDLNDSKIYSYKEFEEVRRDICNTTKDNVKAGLNDKNDSFTLEDYNEIRNSTIDIYINTISIIYGKFSNLKRTSLHDLSIKDVPMTKLGKRDSIVKLINKFAIDELKSDGGRYEKAYTFLGSNIREENKKNKIAIRTILGNCNSVEEFNRLFDSYYTMKENNKK